MAPATIRVRVGVEPDADNRVLNVIADSGAYYRSSEIQLDGERAPRLLVVEFPSLPGGSYTVQGMLRDENGRRSASVIQEIRVVPSAGERDRLIRAGRHTSVTPSFRRSRRFLRRRVLRALSDLLQSAFCATTGTRDRTQR